MPPWTFRTEVRKVMARMLKKMRNKAVVDRLNAVASDESGSKMVATGGVDVEDSL